MPSLRLNICLVILTQISQLTQFFVMMQFFWNARVDKDWVHRMDVVDDIFNAGITAIYCFIFSTFATSEQRIRVCAEIQASEEGFGVLCLPALRGVARERRFRVGCADSPCVAHW